MASNLEANVGKHSQIFRFRSSKAFIIFVVSYAIFVVSSTKLRVVDFLLTASKDQFVFAVIVPVMPFALHQHVGVPNTSGKLM